MEWCAHRQCMIPVSGMACTQTMFDAYQRNGMHIDNVRFLSVEWHAHRQCLIPASGMAHTQCLTPASRMVCTQCLIPASGTVCTQTMFDSCKLNGVHTDNV